MEHRDAGQLGDQSGDKKNFLQHVRLLWKAIGPKNGGSPARTAEPAATNSRQD
jgi:hypothetical protein